MKTLTVPMLILITWLSSGVVFDYFSSSKEYSKGFQAGIQYEKQMRKQAHDSIVANCTWTGVPDTISTKSELNNGGSYKIIGKDKE